MKIKYEFENLGHKNNVVWNHDDYDLIHVDQNHYNSNELIPVDYTNIGSFHDSINIRIIESMFLYPVLTQQKKFTYGRVSDPPSQLNNPSA